MCADCRIRVYICCDNRISRYTVYKYLFSKEAITKKMGTSVESYERYEKTGQIHVCFCLMGVFLGMVVGIAVISQEYGQKGMLVNGTEGWLRPFVATVLFMKPINESEIGVAKDGFTPLESTNVETVTNSDKGVDLVEGVQTRKSFRNNFYDELNEPLIEDNPEEFKQVFIAKPKEAGALISTSYWGIFSFLIFAAGFTVIKRYLRK